MKMEDQGKSRAGCLHVQCLVNGGPDDVGKTTGGLGNGHSASELRIEYNTFHLIFIQWQKVKDQNS